MQYLMMKTLFLIFLTICVYACTSQTKPQPIIPEKKLVGVLKDLMIVDAGINRSTDPKLNKDSLAAPYYQAVYKKHGVSYFEFYASLAQYYDHPTQMDSLFAKVLEQLQIEQAQYEARNKR
jgi:hypothetical protein